MGSPYPEVKICRMAGLDRSDLRVIVSKVFKRLPVCAECSKTNEAIIEEMEWESVTRSQLQRMAFM